MSAATQERPTTLEELQQRLAVAEARAETAEQERRALLAKRAASEQEVENEAATIRSEKSEAKATDAKLAKQKTFVVFLHQNEEGQPQLPAEPVQINGGKIYQVTRGEDVEVPEDIYRVLVSAGLTRPQRQEDYPLYPKKSVKHNNSKTLMAAV